MFRIITTLAVFVLFLPNTQQTLLENGVYHQAPKQSVFHCSRMLNQTKQVGCSSRRGGSSGVVYFTESESVLAQLLPNLTTESILAVDLNVFLNVSLMRMARSTQAVSGIIVFTSRTNDTSDLPGFSESRDCPNSDYGYYEADVQCNVTHSWNPYGSAYSTFDWPFPVVLIRDAAARSDLLECYYKFNVNVTDDTRCSLEIVNFMAAIGSSETCIRRQVLMSLHAFQSPLIYCDELTGLNIVLSATNTTVAPTSVHGQRAENSSILLLARMDSRSMFERSAFGSQSVLPGVSVMLAVAVHLMQQPAFKNLELRRDLFFAFLDNEAHDFLGSIRLAHDLFHKNLVSFTGSPLQWEHLHSVVELGEIGLPERNVGRPMYYMNTDIDVYNQTKLDTDELLALFTAAGERFGQVNFVRPSNPSLPLPPTASVQELLVHAPRKLPHLVLSDHDGPPFRDHRMESFLDFGWPPSGNPDADRTLLDLANAIADAVHRLTTANSAPMTSTITHVTPGELMNCFVTNLNCTLLQTFLSPSDVDFLISLGTPIPAQSYTPIDNRELKVSHIVQLLLMGLTGQRTTTRDCPVDTKDDPYAYYMGYYNGFMQCYRTLLSLARRFPALWVRSRVVAGHQYVRWYRSSSLLFDVCSLVIGVVLCLLTLLCVYLLRGTINTEIWKTPITSRIQVCGDSEEAVRVRERTV